MPAKPITVPMPILRLATGTLALALLPVPLAAQEEGVATAPQTHWTATDADRRWRRTRRAIAARGGADP